MEFGYCISTSKDDACKLNEDNGNNKWATAIDSEAEKLLQKTCLENLNKRNKNQANSNAVTLFGTLK